MAQDVKQFEKLNSLPHSQIALLLIYSVREIDRSVAVQWAIKPTCFKEEPVWRQVPLGKKFVFLRLSV
jgi:hypothetical protein